MDILLVFCWVQRPRRWLPNIVGCVRVHHLVQCQVHRETIQKRFPLLGAVSLDHRQSGSKSESTAQGFQFLLYCLIPGLTLLIYTQKHRYIFYQPSVLQSTAVVWVSLKWRTLVFPVLVATLWGSASLVVVFGACNLTTKIQNLFQILFIYPYQERSRTPANSTSKAQAQIIISFFGRLYILVTKLLKAKK